MSAIKVLIADDHAIVRMGLSALLDAEDDIEVVGEADDGKAAVKAVLKLQPDVVVLDLMMPVLDGIAATREIKLKLPAVKVLILTTSTVSDDLAHAIDAGADGAITKSTANAKLLSAIRTVAAGRKFISPEVAQLIATDPPAPSLTDRQRDILDGLTRGLTNAEIANLLGITLDSVKEHINVVFSKLGAANRAEAVAIALRKQLLKI